MFPPIELADEDGVLCYGGDLSVETLCEAYSNGIFPWPHAGLPLLWFAPPERGVIFLDEFTLSRRTRRAIRSAGYTFKINTCFEAVIQSCAKQRESTEGTWITSEMQTAYLEMHRQGWAHSVETYLGEELVGGLYGIGRGKYFGGESMFYRADNASKAALAFLVEHLQEQDVHWIDSQVLNPFFASMGAREIPRAQFMEMLDASLSDGPDSLFPKPTSTA